mgnify:CR=1 FL=1
MCVFLHVPLPLNVEQSDYELHSCVLVFAQWRSGSCCHSEKAKGAEES